MTKTSAKIILIIFGNLLVFIFGGGIFLFYAATGWSIGLVSSILGVIHIVLSMASCRRFKRRFDISPGNYVLYSAAPAFLICVVFTLIGLIAAVTGMPVIGNIAAVLSAYAAFPVVYSVCYMSALSIAAAFC